VKKKNLVILGSTGSIGRSALDVVRNNADRINVIGFSAHSNTRLLIEQIEDFRPKFIAVTDKAAYDTLRNSGRVGKSELLDFDTGIESMATLPDADIILNAITGAAGLKASLEAVSGSRRLALANKESLVIGGKLLNELAAQNGAEIIPVDSEHSAVWQALFSGQEKEVRRIILTASGGPFLNIPLSEFNSITKERALRHPTWKMGPKITVDSATMMNKGLEIIEAMHLFHIPPDRISVVIHPQSIIHSMVEFIDSSIIAQMSSPDMRLPISYALFYPERIQGINGQLELTEVERLTFLAPDFDRFPLLALAYEVAAKGGTTPAVFNAANEVAVDAFLNDIAEFKRIPDIVTNAVREHTSVADPTLLQILEADQWARQKAKGLVR
jgi:1-deoxy-D-xylulose-5-phosphate reductoisomerase